MIRTLVPEGALPILSSIQFLYRVRGGIHQGSDALLIGGGNLLMDLYPGWPIRPYAAVRSFTGAGKPVAILGVGAFPFRTWWGEWLLRRSCELAVVCTVRDQQTLEYVRNEWGADAVWQPDLALSVPFELDTRSREPGRVCVNVAPYILDGSIQDRLQRLLLQDLARELGEFFRRQGRRVRFTLVDTNYPTDRNASRYLMEKMISVGVEPDHVEHVDRLLSTQETLELFATAEAAVTMRLHAGLLAIRAGTPIVALEYQPKVRTVLASLGLERAVLAMDDVNGVCSRMETLRRSPGEFALGKDLERLDALNRERISSILAQLESGAERPGVRPGGA